MRLALDEIGDLLRTWTEAAEKVGGAIPLVHDGRLRQFRSNWGPSAFVLDMGSATYNQAPFEDAFSSLQFSFFDSSAPEFGNCQDLLTSETHGLFEMVGYIVLGSGWAPASPFL